MLLGLVFDYTNGFHDAANVVATVIATRVLAPTTAIVLAGVLNLLGATQVSAVAHTITNGIVESSAVSSLTILAAVLGAIVWNIITWYFGMASSSSYALIGGLVGAAFVSVGEEPILWNGLIYKVAIPMVLSPIIGYAIAFFFMKTTLFCLSKRKKKDTQGVFSHLQVGSASVMALAHGLNDAQKSMGIITLGLFASGFLQEETIPFWVIVSCALMMGLGTAFGGMRIIRTVGFSITKLLPVQGFAAEVSASCVLLVASFLGMPISSTHMIVGSVTGVGAANGKHAVEWTIIHKLIVAWTCTLPGSALLSASFWFLFSFLFNL